MPLIEFDPPPDPGGGGPGVTLPLDDWSISQEIDDLILIQMIDDFVFFM